MWVFNRDGLFSVVKNEYCREGELMVRARCREDLQRALRFMGIKAKIRTFKGTDYAYRVKLK